jgi:hypothetical protein
MIELDIRSKYGQSIYNLLSSFNFLGGQSSSQVLFLHRDSMSSCMTTNHLSESAPVMASLY